MPTPALAVQNSQKDCTIIAQVAMAAASIPIRLEKINPGFRPQRLINMEAGMLVNIMDRNISDKGSVASALLLANASPTKAEAVTMSEVALFITA